MASRGQECARSGPKGDGTASAVLLLQADGGRCSAVIAGTNGVDRRGNPLTHGLLPAHPARPCGWTAGAATRTTTASIGRKRSAGDDGRDGRSGPGEGPGRGRPGGEAPP